ncbi:hypothetical protein F01_460201 [Burkholderia cenocepacia]|nr:hypothetical protein F01_460201 [Burkholderia cenocepacia]
MVYASPDMTRILSGVRSRLDQRFVRRQAWIVVSVGLPSRWPVRWPAPRTRRLLPVR